MMEIPTCLADVDISCLLKRENLEALYDSQLATDYKSGINEHEHSQLYNKDGASLIPDFEEENPTKETCDKYLNLLMVKENLSIKNLNKNFPSSIAAQKRISIINAILQTICQKYHKARKYRDCSKMSTNLDCDKKKDTSKIDQNNILLELSVKTLMTFMFSLLRISKKSSDMHMRLLCEEVLCSCSDIIMTVPPLSFWEESNFPNVAKNCLDEVILFMIQIMTSKDSFESDLVLETCASNVVLGLSMLRGKLKYLLSWVNECIKNALGGGCCKISVEKFVYWINQISEEKLDVIFSSCFVFLFYK